MIKYIKLKNYRCFTDFHIDFTTKNGVPLKLVIIYGANGSGKSSLMNVFETLYDSMQTMNIQNAALNVLNEKKPSNRPAQFKDYVNTSIIIQKNKTISSTDNMVIEIGFQIDGRNGAYTIEYDNSEIVAEKLEYTLDKNKGIYYSINGHAMKINGKIFGAFRKELFNFFDRFQGKHSLLSFLIFSEENFSKGFFDSTVSRPLLEVLKHLKNISVYVSTADYSGGLINCYDRLFPHELQEGELPIKNHEILDKAEDALNTYFTSIDENIINVHYNRKYHQGTIGYTLYFEKLISGEIKSIPYYNESSGIRKLIYLLPYFVEANSNNTVIIDEIDNGIHDYLLNALVKCVYKYINGQMIITTHNTSLMNEFEFKDSLYFIKLDKNGERSITTPSSSGYRIQPNSNVVLNYLNGHFSGIPKKTVDIDFNSIVL